MDDTHRLHALRVMQRALDERFRIPGTSIRFGWDPVIGLVPWAGDALTAILACIIVGQAYRMRVPRIVQWRMLMNIGIDVLIGIVPFVGDIADLFWKANTRNVRLLERYADAPGPATLGDWLFVSAAIISILVIAAVPLIMLYVVVRAIAGA